MEALQIAGLEEADTHHDLRVTACVRFRKFSDRLLLDQTPSLEPNMFSVCYILFIIYQSLI